MRKRNFKKTLIVSTIMLVSLITYAQEPPTPPGAEQSSPHEAVRVVKPKQDTGHFAVFCPKCGQLEVVKALKMSTNGGSSVERPGFSTVYVTVTARCPSGKKKDTFTFHVKRYYKVQPDAVEVEPPAPLVKQKTTKVVLHSPKT